MLSVDLRTGWARLRKWRVRRAGREIKKIDEALWSGVPTKPGKSELSVPLSYTEEFREELGLKVKGGGIKEHNQLVLAILQVQ
jgi:hypothetical protein